MQWADVSVFGASVGVSYPQILLKNKAQSCHPSLKRKNDEIIAKIYDWLQRDDPFQKSCPKNVLIFLSTGLYCEDDSINVEQEEDVG